MMNVSLVQQSRHNEECSAVVNRGILVQSSFNTVCAIEYMKSHNVDPKVIERVLLHPDQRREVTH
jgi:hypothetical protein